MTKFQRLFGIKESDIKNTCLLMPLLPKGALDNLGIKGLFKGKIYSSGNSEYLTLINTGIGSAFTGDAVLYLKDTNCKNLILFGSCGLVKPQKDLDIGVLVAPSLCYSMESFTDLLLKNHAFGISYPNKGLVEDFLSNAKDINIQKVTCATLGSLKLEEDNMDLFAEKNIQVVDMECSGFFSAAKYVKLNAMALFYIRDIINNKPFYINFSPEDKRRLSSSIRYGIKSLCRFIEKNLTS